MPEGTRYRPGFVIWNALQWHTIGAPTHFLGPQLWGDRAVGGADPRRHPSRALAVGQPTSVPRWTLAACHRGAARRRDRAVDRDRHQPFGPQEPLLVGSMALGAVLLVHAIDRLLDGDRAGPGVLAAPRVRARALGVRRPPEGAVDLRAATRTVPVADPGQQRGRWARLDDEKASRPRCSRGGILLPFVPMVVRTVQLAITGEPLYGDLTAGTSLTTRLSNQLSQAGEILHTQLPTLVVVAAIVLLAAVALRVGVDWLSVGLLVVVVRVHRLRRPRWRRREPLLHPLDHPRGTRARAERRAPRVRSRGRRRGATDRRWALAGPERP